MNLPTKHIHDWSTRGAYSIGDRLLPIERVCPECGKHEVRDFEWEDGFVVYKSDWYEKSSNVV